MIPGTGVSLEPVAGSVLAPTGAALVSADGRVVTTVAIGPTPTLREAVPRGDGAWERADRLGEWPARRGRLRERRRHTELERNWLFAHGPGGRSMLLSIVLPADLALDLGAAVRASLNSVRWDAGAPLDPVAALGIEPVRVEGLEVAQEAAGAVGLVPPGEQFPPHDPRRPYLAIIPSPVRIVTTDDCLRVASALLDADPRATSSAALEGRSGECEMTHRPDGASVRYAALVGRQPQAFVLLGESGSQDAESWLARFGSVARTLRAARSAAPSR
ncbi:MAG: hypothetical protein NZ898_07210 [Myxococcota bacterium]|nr:hypothetical protein [Myxococcota bacterium]MDW8362598.1 hypothetical protein [Myxococcales bacterium]